MPVVVKKSHRPWDNPSDGMGDTQKFYWLYDWNVKTSGYSDAWLSVDTNMEKSDFLSVDGLQLAYTGWDNRDPRISYKKEYPLNSTSPVKINISHNSNDLPSRFWPGTGVYFRVKDQFGGDRGAGGEDEYFSFKLYEDRTLKKLIYQGEVVVLPAQDIIADDKSSDDNDQPSRAELVESNNINGTWKSDSSWNSYPGNLFTLNYGRKKITGAYKYGEIYNAKGSNLRAEVWNDKDQDGIRDRGEKIIASFRAKYSTVYRLSERASGALVINKDKGEFYLHHQGQRFGNGEIIDMKYFFGGNTSQKKNKSNEKSSKNLKRHFRDADQMMRQWGFNMHDPIIGENVISAEVEYAEMDLGIKLQKDGKSWKKNLDLLELTLDSYDTELDILWEFDNSKKASESIKKDIKNGSYDDALGMLTDQKYYKFNRYIEELKGFSNAEIMLNGDTFL